MPLHSIYIQYTFEVKGSRLNVMLVSYHDFAQLDPHMIITTKFGVCPHNGYRDLAQRKVTGLKIALGSDHGIVQLDYGGNIYIKFKLLPVTEFLPRKRGSCPPTRAMIVEVKTILAQQWIAMG